MALLERVRAENPDAVVIYKPHPDVEAGLRPGRIDPERLAGLADVVAHHASAPALMDRVDALWTITSTMGFEALLRGLPVTTLGAPFYAGWGLTRDLGPVPARRRIEADPARLIHAVLIAYPRYFDPRAGLPCPPETALARLSDPDFAMGGPALRLLAKARGCSAAMPGSGGADQSRCQRCSTSAPSRRVSSSRKRGASARCASPSPATEGRPSAPSAMPAV